ncbi:phospholipase effector Tle1 domain-containing protein [Dyadobacter sp. CY343]|uniref:phospholipase effector Tle1 domain-containing protein n=1 Tax=Dyadobacter sp. CY343 TaxID=2907299 RepID=UPI001F1EDC8E|nr:DUF2235 domain-containing protein [Dyadobacter sp. CY343]MCE7059236.1 DUF2235 domain-containing protein [Dyadobacter sp. CY343]
MTVVKSANTSIRHLLLAVDGTNSAEWRDKHGQNSHVLRFYNDFGGWRRKYKDGPGTFGTDTYVLIQEGLSWIIQEMNNLIRTGISQENIKLNLVGHSRGGFVVMKIAEYLRSHTLTFDRRNYQNRSYEEVSINKSKHQLDKETNLRYPVRINFMGLYDPVDSAGGLDCDLTTPYVDHVVNVVRDNPGKLSEVFGSIHKVSRPLMFNSLILKSGELFRFDTSHGGIGGDPGFFVNPYANPISNDHYCNAMPLILSDEELKVLAGFTDFTLSEEHKYNRMIQIKRFWNESRMADQVIRNAATSAGPSIPLCSINQFVPWQAKDNEYGNRLRRVMDLNYNPMKVYV